MTKEDEFYIIQIIRGYKKMNVSQTNALIPMNFFTSAQKIPIDYQKKMHDYLCNAQMVRGAVKKTVYLNTLFKLRLIPLPPTLFLTNLLLTQC